MGDLERPTATENTQKIHIIDIDATISYLPKATLGWLLASISIIFHALTPLELCLGYAIGWDVAEPMPGPQLHAGTISIGP